MVLSVNPAGPTVNEPEALALEGLLLVAGVLAPLEPQADSVMATAAIGMIVRIRRVRMPLAFCVPRLGRRACLATPRGSLHNDLSTGVTPAQITTRQRPRGAARRSASV